MLQFNSTGRGMKLAPFLLVVILAFPLSAQEQANSAVENLVHDYCGEDPYNVAKAKYPDRLFAPRDAQKDPYLRCREMVVAKALDAHFVTLKEENERMSKALLPLCALASTSVSPKVHRLIAQACAAQLPPNP
jgi:hypothetical protein